MKKDITTCVAEQLDRMQLEYQLIEQHQFLRMSVSGANGIWSVIIQCDEDDKIVCIRNIADMKVNDSKYPALCELIARINNDFVFGHFTLDLVTGELALIMTIFLKGIEFPEDQLLELFYASFERFDRYLTMLIKVNETDLHPSVAFWAYNQHSNNF